MSGGGAVPRAARVRFNPRAAAVFGAGYTEEGKTPQSDSRMWVYGSNIRSGKAIRIFEYQPDRTGERCKRFLSSFNGALVTDGYAGYNAVENVTRCGCWAHMRRAWRDAMPKGATTANSKAAVGYNYCNKLFALERKWKDLNNAQMQITLTQHHVHGVLAPP